MLDHIQKLIFIIVCIVIISGKYVTHLLPHQTNHFFTENPYIKHVLGFLLVFIFIMQHGGFSFDQELQNREPVDWSNGNTFDTLIFTFILYLLFIVITKMKLIPNMIFLSLLFLMYIFNSQREFFYKRSVINYKDNLIYENYIRGLAVFIVLFSVFGVYDYYKYQKIQYGDQFNIVTFWFSVK